jgi:hypothetical protein
LKPIGGLDSISFPLAAAVDEKTTEPGEGCSVPDVTETHGRNRSVRHSLMGRAINPVRGDFQDSRLRHKIKPGSMLGGSQQFAWQTRTPIGQEIFHAIFD